MPDIQNYDFQNYDMLREFAERQHKWKGYDTGELLYNVGKMRNKEFGVKLTDELSYTGSFELLGKKPKVKIVMHDPSNSASWAPEAPEYLMQAMSDWCEQTNCGRRTAYNMFEFNDKEEVLMFKLRWM